jgi:hypothetical protein
MSRAAGAVALVFALGGGVMTALSSVLGTHAETVALTLVGLALFGTGQVLGGKPAAAPTRSTETALSKAN